MEIVRRKCLVRSQCRAAVLKRKANWFTRILGGLHAKYPLEEVAIFVFCESQLVALASPCSSLRLPQGPVKFDFGGQVPEDDDIHHNHNGPDRTEVFNELHQFQWNK